MQGSPRGWGQVLVKGARLVKVECFMEWKRVGCSQMFGEDEEQGRRKVFTQYFKGIEVGVVGVTLLPMLE